MKITAKQTSKSEVELTIELSLKELKPYLEQSAKEISKTIKIPGFRPGKVPYEMTKTRAGEMAIYEQALQNIVLKTYAEAVEKERLETVGQPKISVEKIAPGNPLIYKATVALFPKTELGEYKKISIKRKQANVDQQKIDETLEELRKMQSKEVLVSCPAGPKDKIVIDMEMLQNKVPVEEGQAKDYAIYLSEKHYIPGLAEKLVGARAGEIREFQLVFPNEHYQKHLAGKSVDFKVKIKSVYEITPPKLDDEFARGRGQKSLKDLRLLISQNLLSEAQRKEKERCEIEMLEKVIEKAKFGDIPSILINEEVNRMVHELKSKITEQGAEFNTYLMGLKKSIEDLKLDLVPQAIKRIKTALVVREIARQEKINITDKEVMEEVERQTNAYKDDAETQKQIRSPEYAQYLRTVLRNRKVIKFLKELIVR